MLIQFILLLNAAGYAATTANMSNAGTDATQIRITFDRPMANVTSAADTGDNFKTSAANVLNATGTWNSDMTQITFALGTVVTGATGETTPTITFGTNVKTAEGAGIDATTAKITISIDASKNASATFGANA